MSTVVKKKPTTKAAPASSIGLKITMATTGLILVAYLIVHMLGNLKIFGGADAINNYAQGLRTFGEPILPYGSIVWLTRAVLLTAVLIHIWSATVLTLRNRAARPVKYAHRPPVRGEGSYAARTMRWGGVVVALFAIWHILDLTTRAVNPVKDTHDVYDAIVQGFAPDRWPVTTLYIVAIIFVTLHLRHGIWSAVQTIAGPNDKWRKRTQVIAWTLSSIIGLGFLSVPIAVIFGVVS